MSDSCHYDKSCTFEISLNKYIKIFARSSCANGLNTLQLMALNHTLGGDSNGVSGSSSSGGGGGVTATRDGGINDVCLHIQHAIKISDACISVARAHNATRAHLIEQNSTCCCCCRCCCMYGCKSMYGWRWRCVLAHRQ